MRSASGRKRQSTWVNAARISSGCWPRKARTRRTRLIGTPIQTRSDRNGDRGGPTEGSFPFGTSGTSGALSGSSAYRAGGDPARRSESIRRPHLHSPGSGPEGIERIRIVVVRPRLHDFAIAHVLGDHAIELERSLVTHRPLSDQRDDVIVARHHVVAGDHLDHAVQLGEDLAVGVEKRPLAGEISG